MKRVFTVIILVMLTYSIALGVDDNKTITPSHDIESEVDAGFDGEFDDEFASEFDDEFGDSSKQMLPGLMSMNFKGKLINIVPILTK